MANFFAELKRRHIYRVAAAYAVVAWVLLQLFNNLTPLMRLPDWAGTLVLVLLVGGFPIAIFFAWMRELPPLDVSTHKPTVADWALVGVMVAVLAAVTYQQFAPVRTTRAAEEKSLQAARQAAVKPAGVSIAVLPFANLSGDATQEFFSDGMTEEITAALAKIPDLRVVARTSAFQFKTQNRDIQSIGQQLHASHFIEGSVRKAGNRVRITAQLIKADDGTHIWTENYDRELSDVFAIQEDIAQSIANALRVPLGLAHGQSLVSNRSIEPASYQDYLRARALVRARGIKPLTLTEAAMLLEQVVARDAGYAPAWAMLALAYDLTPQLDPAWLSGSASSVRRVVDATQPRAELAAQKAIQLDPGLADGYLPFALVNQRRGNLLAAEEMFSKALALDPNNSDILNSYSNFLAGMGRLKEALTLKQSLQALEPFVPVFGQNAAVVLWLNGKDDEALALLKALPPSPNRPPFLAQIYASKGRYSEAADALEEIPPGVYPPASIEAAVRILRSAPAAGNSRDFTAPLLGTWFVALYSTTPERSFEPFELAIETAYFVAINNSVVWHPSYSSLRKTERFKAYVRKAGIIDYWRAKGWPEFCHPTTGEDFECN